MCVCVCVCVILSVFLRKLLNCDMNSYDSAVSQVAIDIRVHSCTAIVGYS
jgi:hypothetical protein